MPLIIDTAGIDYTLIKKLQTEEGQTELTRQDFEVDPSDYILLEARNAGKDSYPDLWVCKYRLGASPAVKRAGEKLGLSLRNTAEEKNGRSYVGNINREQAVKLNLLLGGRIPNITIETDFIKTLDSGKAFDGNGKRVNGQELVAIKDEIIGVRNPWRSEWLEDYFTMENGTLTLNKNHVLEGEEIIPKYSHKLTSCLMENRLPGIDVKDWLKKPTAQGLPRKNVKEGDLYLWHPREDGAVGFDAGPDGALFGCDGDPQYSYSGLGGRHAREAPQKFK